MPLAELMNRISEYFVATIIALCLISSIGFALCRNWKQTAYYLLCAAVYWVVTFMNERPN